jgi:hypothetical protein
MHFHYKVNFVSKTAYFGLFKMFKNISTGKLVGKGLSFDVILKIFD